MSFQSLEFAAFLLLALCAYYAAPAKFRIWVLLLENAAFFLWADLRAGIWLAISIGTTWVTALMLERLNKKGKRLLLALCFFVNLGLLVVFKYLPVWDDWINMTYGNGLKIVNLDVAGRLGLAAPLGISFYTLQAAGYLLDVASGKYRPEKNPVKYAVFVSFFPNILSGPIERGDHFLLQLDKILKMGRRKLLDYDRIVQGMISVLLGFFMKMVIADRLSILVDYVYGMYQNSDSFTMLVAALFYAVQIYCDFNSYSCIAVGVAQIMGFSLIRNFSQPYFAAGISDFWRRWHISFSSWLRDYVYIPLGGNRKGILRKYGNLLAVFLVSGLWHGGAPTFLVWGLLHGICQIIEDFYRRVKRRILKGRELPLVKLRRLLAQLCTFLTVSVLWIFFRSDTLEMAKVCLVNLFTKRQGFAYAKDFIFVMGLEREQMLAAAVFVCFLFILDAVSERKGKAASAWIYESATGIRWGICLFMAVAVAVFGMYGPGFDPSGFIYVNF